MLLNLGILFCRPLKAIQDITRNRDIDPEEIVMLIFEKIDVKGEGNDPDVFTVREVPTVTVLIVLHWLLLLTNG